MPNLEISQTTKKIPTAESETQKVKKGDTLAFGSILKEFWELKKELNNKAANKKDRIPYQKIINNEKRIDEVS